MAKLYGSVNGETKEVNKLYGSIHKIITRYIVTGFENRLPQYFNSTTFNNRYIAQYGDMEVAPAYLRVITAGGYSTARLVFQDTTHVDLFYWPEGSYTTQGNEWGFLTLSPVDGAAYSTPQTQQKDVATQIGKVYGSVNGEAKLIYNGITREAEGTSITINGTSDATLDSVTLKGDTTQQTYTGKNLVPYPSQSGSTTVQGVIFTQSADGKVTASGTTTAGMNWYYTNTFYPTESAQYALSFTGTIVNVNLFCYDLTSSALVMQVSASQSSSVATLTAGHRYQIYFNQSSAGKAVSIEGYCQLEKGSASTPYEIYTGGIASPNPSYPQDVDTVTGEQTVKVTGGKNILDPSDIHNGSFTTYTELQEDDYTETGNTKYRTIKINMLPAGTYTLSINWSYTARMLRYAIGGSVTTLSRDNNTWTFTMEAAGMFGLSFRTTTSIDFSDSEYTIQIEKNPTATSYEPYRGADYKVNLGKNIWDPTNAQTFVTAVNNSDQASLETYDGRNCVYWTAAAGYGSYGTKNLTLGIKFKPNTQYTISYTMAKTGSTARTIAIYYTDGTNSKAAEDLPSTETWTSQTITSTAGKTIAYIAPWYSSGQTYLDIDSFQIELGDRATAYALYFTPIELCKIGTYQDYIWKDGADWKVHKAVGKVVLDGTDTSSVAYNLYGAKTNVEAVRVSISGIVSGNSSLEAKSNNFNVYGVGDWRDWYSTAPNIQVGNMGKSADEGGVYFGIPAAENTLALVRAWFSSHQTTLYYQLATPTDTTITDATLVSQLEALAGAQSYAPQTNITAATPSPNLPTILDVVAFINGFTGPLS